MKLENGREIRFITEEWLEDYLDIYLNAYPAFKSLDAECREAYREKTLTDMSLDDDVKFTGLFEDGKLIAIMKLVSFSMNLYGQMKPAVGLMSLGVHPMYKKRGAALDMVRFFEEYTSEQGGLVALLLPFNMGFYHKMGYGYGSKMEQYHIPSAQLPECEDTTSMVLLGADDLEKVISCHRRFVENNHGQLQKFSEELRQMKKDTQTTRVGLYGGEQLAGYLAYRYVCDSQVNYTLNHIEVDEMVYDSPQILKVLLGFLRNQADLAQSVVINTGEPDFYHLLDSAQDVSGYYIPFGYLQSNRSAIGTMHKIINPEKFIEETRMRRFPPVEIKVKFVCEDELAHKTEIFSAVFRKTMDGRCSHWENAEQGDEAVTLTCGKGNLSSLFLGSCQLGGMVRLGAVKLSDESYLELLDSLFYCTQKPFSNSDY